MEETVQTSTGLKPTIIPVILKGLNYTLWSRTIKTAICGKGLWEHIESDKGPSFDESEGDTVVTTEGQPAAVVKASLDAAKRKKEMKWFQEDQSVLGFLQNSLEPSILEAYSHCETAKALWDTLKRVYGDISNLSRVYEVKKALNDLNQEDMEFKKFLGKYESTWSELDTLRPSTMDSRILLERKEQDKVFGLLLSLNPAFNDVTKSILRETQLPSFEDVCARLQREQGTIGLFSGKGEVVAANKSMVKGEDKKSLVCEHCKKKGHSKDKCWILHPHLKPAKFKEPKAHMSQETATESGSTSTHGKELVIHSPTEYVKMSDLEELIKAYASKHSGITLYSYKYFANDDDKLIVDSGASHHMIKNARLLENIKPASGSVTIADGKGVPIVGTGKLRLFDKNSNAFYVPKFKSNLVSVKRATKDLNCNVTFTPNSVHFQDIESGKMLGSGGTQDELYILEDASSSNLHSVSLKSRSQLNKSCFHSNKSVLWHARMGHPHARPLSILFPNVAYHDSACEACILGKHSRAIFPKSSTIYENCFDLVHSDVWTSPCLSRDSKKYFVTFIDQKSKYTWITLLPTKDRVYEAFMNFHKYITNQFNAKLKVFRSDNGGEYTSHRFKEYLNTHGIIHQTSCPNTPEQNGVAERKNRHLMEVARSMMFHTNVPKRFWSDAVMTACYLINRTPTKVLQDLSPFEVLNQTKPSLDYLRVFGCVCFVFVPGEQRSKLEPKSVKCMFLGYSTTQKGYKCYDPTKNRTYISRDVKFVEEQGYYDKKDWDGLKDLSRSPSDLATSLRYLLNHLGNGSSKETREEKGDEAGNGQAADTEQERVETETETENEKQDSNEEPEREVIQEVIQEPTQNQYHDQPQASNQDQEDLGMDRRERSVSQEHQEEGSVAEKESETEEDSDPDWVQQHDAPVQQLRRSERLKFDPSNWVNTRVYYNNQAVAHPIQAVCSIELLPANHQAFLGKIDMHYVPQTYEEAKGIKEWTDAIGDERGAMERNHTWDVEAIPKGKKTVSSRWIFTIKYKSDGEIERYKARLVARGFTQTYGEDYLDTFAPVAKLHTVRVTLSLATNLSWDLWQMDVKNAFLQGELEEEVYMTPPPGLEDLCKPGQALRLRKAIYGLKQSPRAWYHKLSRTLMEYGFKKSQADHTLFTQKGQNGLVVVLVYVDDLIITGDDKAGIQATKDFLNKTFDIKDLGELKYFLGIEVCRSPEGLFLSQRKYVLDLLKEAGKLGCKAAKTPLEDGYKVNGKGEKSDQKFKDVGLYRRMVGKLIYLTLTRPDLCFAVNQVSQHMQKPSVYHWNMVDRILRYLKGSPGQGIWMGKNESTEIVGYCDADWAGDRVDRKSTTGYCTFVGGNLVTWKTKKQKVVSLSSAEAEYRAMRKLATELTWLKALLMDFGIEQKDPITFHCDNKAAIHIATNSVFHERTKHIEIDCHKVREKIEDGTILPCYTKSEDQLADIFTKAASLKVCTQLYSKLGLVDLTKP